MPPARSPTGKKARGGNVDPAAAAAAAAGAGPQQLQQMAAAGPAFESLPGIILVQFMLATDDPKTMCRLCVASKRVATLAGMPARLPDAPAVVVAAWTGGCPEIRAGIQDMLRRQDGYVELARALKKRAETCFSAAVAQLGSLQRLRLRGPTCVVDMIEQTEYTRALTNCGETMLSGTAAGRSFEPAGIAQWNAEEGGMEDVIAGPALAANGVEVVAISMAAAGGRIFVAVGGADCCTIQVWSTATWRREREHDLVGDAAVRSLLAIGDDTLISTDDGRVVRVWQVSESIDSSESWRCKRTLNADVKSFHRAGQPMVVASGDGGLLACSWSDNCIFRWKTSDWTRYGETLETVAVLALAASPPSRGFPSGVLAALGNASWVRIFDFAAEPERVLGYVKGDDSDIVHSLLWCGDVLIAAGSMHLHVLRDAKAAVLVKTVAETGWGDTCVRYSDDTRRFEVIAGDRPVFIDPGNCQLKLAGDTVIVSGLTRDIYMFE